MYLKKPIEITLLNPINSEIYQNLVKRFLPESIFITIQNEGQLAKLKEHPFFEGKEFPNDKTTVFVCKDFTCSLPLDSISEIEKHL